MEGGASAAMLTIDRQNHASVLRWLVQEQWRVDQRGPADCHWLITGEDDQLRRLAIAQPLATPDRLLVQGAVRATKAQARALSALAPEARRTLQLDLGLALVQVGLRFSGIGELTYVVVGRHMFHDELTKGAFLRGMSDVRDGVLLVQWRLASRLTASDGPEAVDRPLAEAAPAADGGALTLASLLSEIASPALSPTELERALHDGFPRQP